LQRVKRIVARTLEIRRQLAKASKKSDDDENGKGYSISQSLKGDRDNISGTLYMMQAWAITPLSWFDQRDDLLPAPNGVIDLRTGELLPHDKDYGFTWNTTVKYDPEAFTGEWEQIISENIQGGEEEANALQTWFGYSFTGETKEEIFTYIYGPGGSGKGLVVGSIEHLLPEPVSQNRSFSTFTARRGDDTNHFDLAGLSRARFVHAHESERRVELNAALVKTLVGSDTLFAAYKGKDGFNFLPKFKTTLTSNFELNADVDDSAIWNRPMVISFPHERRETEQEDKTLKAHFKEPEQQEAILKGVVDGAVRWYQQGLVIPQSFRGDKRQQRERLDMVKRWLEENTEPDESIKTRSMELISNYQDWCKLNTVEPKRGRSFADSMKRKGYEPKQDKQGSYYHGIKIVRTYYRDKGEIYEMVQK
jgi:putative DNA primase/helicase